MRERREEDRKGRRLVVDLLVDKLPLVIASMANVIKGIEEVSRQARTGLGAIFSFEFLALTGRKSMVLYFVIKISVREFTSIEVLFDF